MKGSIRVSAKTLDDAITEALIQLGVTSDRLEYNVIEKGSAGFLGIGMKQAVIEAWKKEDKEEEEFLKAVEETIREKALKLLDDEVPHGIYVETDKMKFRKTKTGEGIYDVSATIYCLRNSHKGIIIGKNGQMLKKIGTYAREDLEKMLDTKINLQLWVKVREDWLNDTALVKKFKLQ